MFSGDGLSWKRFLEILHFVVSRWSLKFLSGHEWCLPSDEMLLEFYRFVHVTLALPVKVLKAN